MKTKELKSLTLEELKERRKDFDKELFRLRLQHATANIENPMRLRTLRRAIARIETILWEKNREKAILLKFL